MIPEVGQFALIVALLLALRERRAADRRRRPRRQRLDAHGAASGARAVRAGRDCVWMSCGVVHGQRFFRPVRGGQFESTLPLIYRFTAVWGGTKARSCSGLCFLRSGWPRLSIFSRRLPLAMVARVLAVMSWIAAGFLFFMLFTVESVRAARCRPRWTAATSIRCCRTRAWSSHPPILYMGYVGFAVAFAFAIAALLSGELNAAWARWSRPWTIAALDLPHARHHARQRLGLLRTRLGRLVVLGPGRERVVHAVARGHGADPLARRHREARLLSKLDRAARHLHVLAEPPGHVPRALGCDRPRCIRSPPIPRAGSSFWCSCRS